MAQVSQRADGPATGRLTGVSDVVRELKERIWDLTREMDESPAAEEIPEIEAKLDRLTRQLNDLRRAMAPEDVVREFCEAWSRRNIDELLNFFTSDAVYHNMPIAPVQGHEGIRNMLNLFVPGAESISFEIVHMAASGNVVHTERVDTFQMGENTVVLPVAGVFELREGKIAAWRDYFDMGAWASQTSG
jgi:limonene-1,2-epoxide hydrolase